MFRNRFAVGLTVCALALVLTPDQAQAQTKPFKVTGGGTAPDGIPLFVGAPPAPHNATGTATHLGKYTGNEGMFTLLSFDPDTLSGTFRRVLRVRGRKWRPAEMQLPWEPGHSRDRDLLGESYP